MPDHTPERAKRLSVFLPSIGEGAQKPLDLSRRPEPLDNGPFSRPKGRSVWPRRKLLPWRGCLAHGLDLGRGGRLRVHSHAFNALGARYCRSGANRGPTIVFLVVTSPGKLSGRASPPRIVLDHRFLRSSCQGKSRRMAPRRSSERHAVRPVGRPHDRGNAKRRDGPEKIRFALLRLSNPARFTLTSALVRK